jgi:hypothetical protein
LSFPAGIKLFSGFHTPSQRLSGSELFYPPLNELKSGSLGEIEVDMHPIAADRLHDYIEAVMIDVVRPNGSVLAPEFRKGMESVVNQAVKNLASARGI